jgi:hypothetical protein
MNELTGLLPVWLRDREVTTPGFAPANTPPPPDPSRTLADGENAPRERSEKLFGTVSEITPVGVKFKNRTNSRSQTAIALCGVQQRLLFLVLYLCQ